MGAKPTIAVIDYGMGNLRSVAKAVALTGGTPVVSDDPATIRSCQGVIFPGVGAFAPAIAFIRRRRLIDTIWDVIGKDRFFLGLCLGFQLLFTSSTEDGTHDGLGVVPGTVQRFSFADPSLKVPHMGWNQVSIADPALKRTMFRGIPDRSFFYFVHSYYGKPRHRAMVAATTDYGKTFCSAVAYGRVWGCQFHPEKSGTIGLRLLTNFVREVKTCS